MSQQAITDTSIRGPISASVGRVLTPEALDFITDLQRTFNARRLDLLAAREARQERINGGEMPGFLPETEDIRAGKWQVAPTPDDLQDRRVEITGPVDRKMMINALNSGAKVFMADFEDSLSPTWANVIEGQINLYDAVRRQIEYTDPTRNKHYTLNDEIAVLLVRPRGWHLGEAHLLIDGEPVSAGLFDFGLYLFHNAKELLARNSGPYFYLPKLESHLEARLWNDVFIHAQDALGIPQGSIRATVLIETILAAFEMEEILYELRDHSAGLNAGRWDYIFSAIKKFASYPEYALPERTRIGMTVPFMRAYTELLVHTCHRRGAHAIGGMAAFIPSRRDEEVNRNAFARVTEDKVREAEDGCDGTWVAHPDLVPLVLGIFDEKLGKKPNQKDILRGDVHITGDQLLSLDQTPGSISEAGLRLNITVAMQYLDSWLNGDGAAAINNLMEDMATAEISRAQLWQWIQTESKLEDGRVITADLYKAIRDEEIETLGGRATSRYDDAVTILDQLILNDGFTPFMTLVAYDYITSVA